MRAIVVAQLGGPEVLHVREVDLPQAGRGEVLIDVDRAGINYSIGRRRSGWQHPPRALPVIPGAIEARETVGKVTLIVDEAAWGQAPAGRKCSPCDSPPNRRAGAAMRPLRNPAAGRPA